MNATLPTGSCGSVPVSDRKRFPITSDAFARIPQRKLPRFWIGSLAALDSVLKKIKLGKTRVIARTPGGHRVHLVTYGDHEHGNHHANFNSATGGHDLSAYLNKAARRRPVILFVGPVHGQETEGLTGVMNLIHIMETGADLCGRDQSDVRTLADKCRLLIVPTGNPDGLARFKPAALQGMSSQDISFWGQGTWADGTLCGWPGCKLHHPMAGNKVGFLGCYFNDNGINPMHDEFLNPMGAEAPAILKVAQAEGPDLAVSLHSHQQRPTLMRPAYVPLEIQTKVRTIATRYYRLLRGAGLEHGSVFNPQAETEKESVAFNFTSALYHVSGATAFTFECPHGTKGRNACKVGFEQILEIQLLLYKAMMQFALAQKEARFHLKNL